MRRLLPAAAPLVLLAAAACVSGNKIRADADVIQADVERARRGGALRCAPAELATAEAELDFARGELSQGESYRASQHIRAADAAAKKALQLSKGCAPKQVVVREPPAGGPTEGAKSPPVVVRIEETDGDGDGVLDKDDPCQDQPEDKDGFEDLDGCPEPDNDLDGVLDAADRCAQVAGVAANGGCPEEAPKDGDGDGVMDRQDRCADQPEDRDGFMDEDGCPDVDDDADGVVDASDQCPRQAGPLQNLGCPVLDGDADGVADPQDKCPKEAGVVDNGGCPDTDRDRDSVVDRLDACPDEPGIPAEKGCARQYKTVVVKRDRIELKQQILFKSGSATIVGRTSTAILDDVAQALRDATHIKKLRIEGHTDSVGPDAANLRLSQRRADAVMAQLLRRGIDPGRMEAVGFGETQPVASNATKVGRAENRRTEFNIVEQ